MGLVSLVGLAFLATGALGQGRGFPGRGGGFPGGGGGFPGTGFFDTISVNCGRDFCRVDRGENCFCPQPLFNFRGRGGGPPPRRDLVIFREGNRDPACVCRFSRQPPRPTRPPTRPTPPPFNNPPNGTPCGRRRNGRRRFCDPFCERCNFFRQRCFPIRRRGCGRGRRGGRFPNFDEVPTANSTTITDLRGVDSDPSNPLGNGFLDCNGRDRASPACLGSNEPEQVQTQGRGGSSYGQGNPPVPTPPPTRRPVVSYDSPPRIDCFEDPYHPECGPDELVNCASNPDHPSCRPF